MIPPNKEDLDNFKTSLDDLTTDRVSIQFFTELLIEKVGSGREVSNIIMDKIVSTTNSGQKLSLFYLMDSVVKNRSVGNRYQQFFSSRLFEVFSKSYSQTNDEFTKQRYLKLLKTWYYVFPHAVLFKIDQFLSQQNQRVSLFHVTQQMRRTPRAFIVNPEIFRRVNIPTQLVQPVRSGMPTPNPLLSTHHPLHGVAGYPPRVTSSTTSSARPPMPYPSGVLPNLSFPTQRNVAPPYPPPPRPQAMMMNQRSHHLSLYPKMNPMMVQQPPPRRVVNPSPSTPSKTELTDLAEEVEKALKNKEEERYVSLVNSLYSDFPLKCQKCGLRFRMQQNLDRHLDKHFVLESEKHYARKWWTKSSEEWINKNELNILRDVLMDPTTIIFGDVSKKRKRIDGEKGLDKGEEDEGEEDDDDGISEGRTNDDDVDEVSSLFTGTGPGTPPSSSSNKMLKGGRRKDKSGSDREKEVLFDEMKEKCPFCREKIKSKFHMKLQTWVFVDATRVDPSANGVNPLDFDLLPKYFFVIHKNCGMNDSINAPNIKMVLEQERQRMLTMSPKPDDEHISMLGEEDEEEDEDVHWPSPLPKEEDDDDKKDEKKKLEEEEEKEDEEEEDDENLIPKKRKLEELHQDEEITMITENLEPPTKKIKKE